jgi:hypothetical protein
MSYLARGPILMGIDSKAIAVSHRHASPGHTNIVTEVAA